MIEPPTLADDPEPSIPRNPDTLLPHRRWTWCQICERVYRTERVVEGRWRCPTQDCSGRMINLFPWENPHFGPRQRHPEYPEEPPSGGWYPAL